MKHVFRVSSHLTFFLSKKIIEVKNLSYDDCILFLVRDYKVPSKYSALFKQQIQTSYNTSEKVGRVFAGANVFKTHSNIKEFDTLVDGYIKGEDFIWYAQICNDDFCSLMVTKANCKGYYVIEDGLGSYIPRNPQTFVGWRYWLYKLILKPLWPRIFAVKNFFIFTDHPKFNGCIGSFPDCFPLHQQYLEAVGTPFEKLYLPEAPEAVLSVDPLYVFNLDENTVEKVYTELADFINKKPYKKIHYKFHPYLNSKANVAIHDSYKRIIDKLFGDKAVELSSDVVLENLFATYKCDFYTNHSTVIIYAANTGTTCYSYSPIIKKYQPDYKEVPVLNKYCVDIPAL